MTCGALVRRKEASSLFSGFPSLRENTQTYVNWPLRMYCRSLSKPVSGDARGVGEDAGEGAGEELVFAAGGIPLQADVRARDNKTKKTLIMVRSVTGQSFGHEYTLLCTQHPRRQYQTSRFRARAEKSRGASYR